MSQTLSPQCSLLWLDARCACVVGRVPASIAPSKRRRRTRSPIALARSGHVRTRNWPTISASK